MERKKEKIIFRYSLILMFFISFYQTTYADVKINKINTKNVNWGIKVGLNALNPVDYKLYDNDILLDKITIKNEIGYSGTVFLRINLSNFFMQPELSFLETRESVNFLLPSLDNDNQFNPKKLRLKEYSFNIPVIIGYNLIKEDTYLLNAFCGPNFRYSYESKYRINNQNIIQDKDPEWDLNLFKINLTFGLSANISNIYFDVRYEFFLSDNDLDFGSIPNIPSDLNNIYLKKSDNLLNFSLGLMF